jgi:hypothetical protein
MSIHCDPFEIGKALAEIASRSEEPETARQLMELVDTLLTTAGLAPEEPGG